MRNLSPFVRSQAVPTKPRRAAPGVSQAAAEDASRQHLPAVPEEAHAPPPQPTQVGTHASEHVTADGCNG